MAVHSYFDAIRTVHNYSLLLSANILISLSQKMGNTTKEVLFSRNTWNSMLQRMSKTFVAGKKIVSMCNEYITKTKLRESPLMKSKLSLSS